MHSNGSRFWVPTFLKRSMLAKLVMVNVVTVVFVLIIALLTVEKGTKRLFTEIMDSYNIEPVGPTQLFISMSMLYILIGGAAALLVGIFINFILNRMWLNDLLEIRDAAKKIAEGGHTKANVRTVDEIGQLADAINQMSDSLQRMKEQRRDLLIDVSHELRTPLTTMKGYLRGVHDGVMEPTPQVISVLSKEVQRLQTLVESIHQLNVLEYTEEKIPFEPVEIVQLIEEMWMLFEYRFVEKDVAAVLNVTNEVSTHPILIHGNRDLLAQVLYNIFENAWRYTLAGDELEVLFTRFDDHVELCVENRGEHLKPIDVSRIFDRFYRTERSRSRETGGLGIGLAIVKQVVLTHRGTVNAISEAGRFRISIILPFFK
jgi:signal transduction histidine kinase